MTRKCPRCKTVKTASDFYQSSSYPNGLSVYCRLCETKRVIKHSDSHRKQRYEYQRKYRKTESGRAAMLRSVKSYEERKPERRKAWTQARTIPRKPCEVCGREDSVRHHPDITKPLFVVMLCPPHHRQAHKINMVQVEPQS
jgi:hypothetical protein